MCLGKYGTLFEEDEPLSEESEQCLCAAGWRGYLCQEDQDECRCDLTAARIERRARSTLHPSSPTRLSSRLACADRPPVSMARARMLSVFPNIRAGATAASADTTALLTSMTAPRSRVSTVELAWMAPTPTFASALPASKEVRF